MVRPELEAIERYYKVATKYYNRVWNRPFKNPEVGFHYGFWEKGITRRYQAIENENRILAKMAQIKEGDIVLDAGSGIAGSGIWLAEHIGAIVIEANVVHAQQIQGTEKAYKAGVSENLLFANIDYHNIALKDGSVDVVWLLESLEHAYNRTQFVNDSYRVLKPDGRMIVAGFFAGPNLPNPEQKRQMKIGADAGGVFRDFGSADELAEMMDTAGFKDIQIQNKTEEICKSARQMELLCAATLWGAKLGNRLGLISETMVLNNEWGTYQRKLFDDNVISYNILIGKK